MTHGGAAPFAPFAFARKFDPADPRDPAEARAHAVMVADVLVAGLLVDPDPRQ